VRQFPGAPRGVPRRAAVAERAGRVAEQALGVQLFERTAAASASAAAAPLIAQARRVLMAAGDLQEIARSGPIRFAHAAARLIPTICPYLPDWRGAGARLPT